MLTSSWTGTTFLETRTPPMARTNGLSYRCGAGRRNVGALYGDSDTGCSAGVLSSVLPSDNMIRTQISLDPHEYAAAKAEARTLGISVAEFVRRAVREAIPPQGNGSWMKYAGFVETGDSRSSQSVDEIVYGQKD